MKRFLLLISAMLVMSGIIAQDIYTSGYYTNDNGIKAAAVYKNGQRLYMLGGSSTSTNYESRAVVVDGTDIYWSVNYINSDNSLGYADVFKNSSTYLNSQTVGRRINDMFYYWGNLYSFGLQTFDGVQKAVVWKNDSSDPYKTFGASTYTSEVTCGTPYLNEGSYFVAGGYQYTSDSQYHGVIWYSKNTSALYTFPEGTKIYDVVYFNGSLYSIGTSYDGSTTTVKVWRNTTELYTYSSTSTRLSLFVDGGAVFATIGGGSDKIYRNNTELYSTGGYFYKVHVNTEGVIACGAVGGKATVWKNNEVLYTFDNNTSHHMAMYVGETTCTDENVRTLPYTEGFEMGVTDWDCWTKIDSDNTPSGISQHWQRAAKGGLATPYSGDYCARHTSDVTGGTAETGWLISPRLFLQPGRDETILTFRSWAHINTNKSVWVSTNSDPTSTGSYTKVWENMDSQSWTNVGIDLSAYQGELIYIAFKYESNTTETASWLVDDVSVTEEWENPFPYEAPYTQDFSATASNLEPGYCWYIIDRDLSGEKKCWKNNSGQAYHPWGQTGIYQTGFMFSPAIELAAGHAYHLTFDTQNNSSGSDMRSEVWISTTDSGTPDPSHYTTQLWQENTSASTHTVDIDLSAYAGQTVRFCFAYRGTYAHAWYVDNFSVTSNDAVNEVGEVILSVYPNPTTESFRINGLEQEVEVNIYNVMGVLMKTVVVNGAEEINVSELPAGIYMARFGETTLRFTKE